MILQTVRNGCIRFGGHVDIEVSYKILWSNVLKETPILPNLSCFEFLCFEAVLMKNTPRTLGIKGSNVLTANAQGLNHTQVLIAMARKNLPTSNLDIV